MKIAGSGRKRRRISGKLLGIPATIPAKINKETPFPIPFSEINSPSHIMIIDPAVIDNTAAIMVIGSIEAMTP